MNVRDLGQARTYYDEFMPLVGFEIFFAADEEFSYRPAGGKPGTYLFFYPALEDGDYSRHRPGLQHLAFMVKTREEVDRLHEWAVKRGANVLYEPQEFPQYGPTYYAVFWEGPDGVTLEAVCHR
ncbi:Glyoxalase/Bleomycin resistance protein/Dioxygenase superfamily protein [Actinomadura mexicana]|uniref:Glyoxalase/Bleomycin resistance protein/Dioxygenase superfamily protein n=1 Tax=Actinomadura mexicana TaxID=134959 RepID=A0A239CZ43_9ACTN|nr:Glyoxalase/Bleomycin resistance protein/Dioxygenase superfamily protein [Actinomadura mexicana]